MSSVNLPFISSPISTQNIEKMVTGFGLSKTSFLCGGNNTKKLFSSQSKRRVLRFRKFKPLNAARSLDHIPKQFREENLKEGLMENYKNVPQQFYGLNRSQMNMFTTKDSPIFRESAKLKEESLSSARSYADSCGMWSMSGMKDGGQSTYCSMNTSMYGGGYGGRTRGPPPDLPSLLLNGRIIYLGMPMVDAVLELIIAQLIYLFYDDPTKPVYVYLNSLGIKNEQNQNVADPINAYAIADYLSNFKSRIYTLNLSCAYGHAAMLLSLGTKGCRFLQPSSSVKLYLPSMDRMNGQSTDMYREAKEFQSSANTYLEFLSRGTGKPMAVIRQDIRRSKTFLAQQAIDYGIADSLTPPQFCLCEDYDKTVYEKRKASNASPRVGGEQAAPF